MTSKHFLMVMIALLVIGLMIIPVSAALFVSLRLKYGRTI